MNRERAKELLPIIEAFANGEMIEFQMSDGTWETAITPTLEDSVAYRIKPKEPREFCLFWDNRQVDFHVLEAPGKAEGHWDNVIKVREVIE